VKLNEALLKKQGINKETEALLEDEYNFLSSVLADPELYTDPVAEVEKREYNLQRLWGFPQDRNYHRYWKHIKGCTCPKRDNEDPMYFGRRITVSDCPWHGSNSCVECGNTESVGHKMSCSKRYNKGE
jgi:hypothetical protein